MRNLLSFYRLTGGRKPSGLRFLIYPLLGFSLSHMDFTKMAADTLAVLGGSMSTFALNDYFDFMLEGERNPAEGMGKKAPVLALSPLLLLSLGLLTTLPTFLLLLLLLLLTLSYSAPPLRLKERKGGFLIPPLCSPLLALQAHLALSPSPSKRVLLLLPLLFLFQLHMEVLHRLSEGKEEMGLLKILPPTHLLLSSLLLLVDPFFLIGVLSSCVRLLSVRRMEERTDFLKLRKEAWRPEVFAEELALYATAGLLT